MNRIHKFATIVSLAGAVLCSAAASDAADILRIPEANPMAPFVELAAVPPGYTTYYISARSPRRRPPPPTASPPTGATSPTRPLRC